MNKDDTKFIIKDLILKQLFGEKIVWIFITISLLTLLYYFLRIN